MNSIVYCLYLAYMYSHLTKREKQKKLAQARKRAILWSAQEQTRSAIRKSSSKAQPKSTKTGHSYMDTSSDNSSTNTLPFSPPIPLQEDQVKTIEAIKATLKDLHEQQQSINITIDVLKQRLAFLTNTKSV